MFKKGFRIRGIYNELVRELSVLAEFDGAETTCLNIFENLPSDVQPNVIAELAMTNNPKLIPFFQLIIKEMQGEIKKAATKALTKLAYLGYEIKPYKSEKISIENIRAYASKTRLQGYCILVFLVETGKEYQTHYFTLNFNHLGIKDYFQHRSSSKSELFASLRKQNLVALDFFEAQQLLIDAYYQNNRYGTKTAKGFSEYQCFLKIGSGSKKINFQQVLRKLNDRKLSPEMIINAYFYALKNMDASLIYDLMVPELQKKFGDRSEFLKNWIHPFEKYTFIKSFSDKSIVNNDSSCSCIQLVASDENDDLKIIKFDFKMKLVKDEWLIHNVEIKGMYPITRDNPLNPLNYKVYTSVYKINQFNKIKEFLDKCDLIHLTGEFEGGVCYKWFQSTDPLEKGIDISKDVYGEFILTNNEFIVFGANLKNVTETSYFLLNKLQALQGISLKLQVRTLCSVRDVYKVINFSQIILSEIFQNRHYSYLIPPASYEDWYMYCKESNSEIYILDKKVRAFQISYQKKIIEIIFYEKCGIINLFNNSMDEVSDALNFPNAKIVKLRPTLETITINDRWYYLKLMNMLLEDPLTRVYAFGCTSQQIANKLNLVISSKK